MNWIDELRRLLRSAKGRDPAEENPGGVTCHEAARHVFEWLDGELPAELQDSVGFHLEACARCYPWITFEQAFQEAVRNASGDEEAPEALRHRVLHSLREEGLGGEA